jgi:FkbM family methyltransferase
MSPGHTRPPRRLVLPTRLRQPQYVLHPFGVVRRLLGRRFGHGGGAIRERGLPWGVRIAYIDDEAIGQSIAASGIFDICVSETIFRLLDPGDLAVDVGANVGYMTSLMARRVGPSGTVMAYEPHPALFEVLTKNVARWNHDQRLGQIVANNVALSDHHGTADLFAPESFDRNVGSASLQISARWGKDHVRVGEVRLSTADEEFSDRPVSLLKIDVEGHESQVLAGAAELLAAGSLRDIILEHKGGYPSSLMDMIEEQGFVVFSLDNSLFGLDPAPAGARPPRQGWEGPSYLASREPERALDRLERRGWAVLGVGRPIAAVKSA